MKPFPPGPFDVIVADPPWRFLTYSPKGKEKKSAECHYQTMTLDAIKALPVAALAAPDCGLFLWATAPMLLQALEVMAAWGFAYKSQGIWHKTTKHGKTAFGTGYRIRNAHEIWLIGVRGNPKNTRSERSVITAPVREHSRKPDELLSLAERWMPQSRRIELFSRSFRQDWQAWGDETGKFCNLEVANDRP